MYFDVLLIVFIAIGVLVGAAIGLYRSGRQLAANGICWMATILIVPRILGLIEKKSPEGWLKFTSGVKKVFGFINADTPEKQNALVFVIVGAVTFIGIWVLTWFLYGLFKPKIDKSISREITKLSRILGGVIGAMNGIFVSLIVYILISGFGFVKPGVIINFFLNLTKIIAGIK